MATTNVQIAPAKSTPAQRIIALGVVFVFLYYASSIVMTLMLAVLLAYFLDPAVVLLERIHVPRALGALVVLLVAIAAVGAIGYLLINRTQSFASAWPRYSAVLRRAAESTDRKIATIERDFSIAVAVPEQVRQQPSVSANGIQELRGWLLHGIGSITSGLLLWAFLPFLVFFMLAAKPRLWRATIELFSDTSRADVRSALDDVNVVLRSYVAGSSLVAGILAAACWIFFAILHLDYAFLAALVSGLVNMIPYVGAILSWIPPFLIGLDKWHSVGPFLIVAGVLSAFHIIAANVLMPAIVGRSVHLNPLAVTISLLFWGWLWGASGLILAIPVTATLKVICDHVPDLQPWGRWLGA
jgi:predicted PurR-regulated permease PerM